MKSIHNFNNFRIPAVIQPLWAKWLSIICLMGLIHPSGNAQSVDKLSIDQLFDRVKMYHPIAQQAELQLGMADAEILKSKGGFDPVIATGLDQKQFADKSYYSLLDGGVRWATPFGATLKSGYEYNRGLFLNPENNTPASGLLYAGISLPLGQGLIIDERRAFLRSAEIGKDVAFNRRRDILNNLLYDASLHYWEWFRTFYIRDIFLNALKNADERYQAVVFNAMSGDRPGIDTVEARIQLQLIEVGLNQAALEFNNAALQFSTFFWNQDNVNTGINSTVAPAESLTIDMVDNLSPDLTPGRDISSSHPYIEQLRQKLLQLEIERKLKQDKLKPVINLGFNPLTEVRGSDLLGNLSLNNFKWGLEFKMPLLLRKERGELRMAEFKIKENDLELDNASVKIQNMYGSYFNEWIALREQSEIFAAVVENYRKMFVAESRLFESGESSLFLVNAREQAYINAQIKYLDILTKFRKAYYSMLYYAGGLPDL